MGILETLTLIIICLIQAKELKEQGKTQKNSYKIYVALIVLLTISLLVKLSYLLGYRTGGLLYEFIN